MYELFILGELLDLPTHGYLLHQTITSAIGPLRQMSWGALYPLIRRLEADGLIEADAMCGGGGDGRKRKIYHITDAGRRRFHDLMLTRDHYDGDYPEVFTIKLSNFHHVGRGEQAQILGHYRGYLQFMQNYLETAGRRVAQKPAISESERCSILRALDHRSHLVRADIEWCERMRACMTGCDEASREDADHSSADTNAGADEAVLHSRHMGLDITMKQG